MKFQKFIGTLLFFSFGFIFISCGSTPKKEEPQNLTTKSETVNNKSLGKEPNNVAFLESISDGRALPSTSVWSEEKYKQYDEVSFRTFPDFSKRISFELPDYGLLNAAIFYYTNLERKKLGMRPLQYGKALEETAFSHSQDMVTYDFYNHTSTVKGKETLKDRLELVGIQNVAIAENILNTFVLEYKIGTPIFTPAQNQNSSFSYTWKGPPIPMATYDALAQEIVEIWMNSPSHRRNILNPNVNYLGCGAYFFSDKKFHGIPKTKVTQVFASRI